MSLIAADKGGANFTPVPVGTHPATCVWVIDMGIQPPRNPQRNPNFKPKASVYLRWEIPGHSIEWTDKDGVKRTGPMVIGQQYTRSLSERAILRKVLESWRGKSFTEQELKGFDVRAVLGKSCLLGIVHNQQGDKTYANIGAVMGLPRGTVVPPPSVKPMFYDTDNHDEEVWQKLPTWLREAIENRLPAEKDKALAGAGGDEDFNDDIPF